MQAQAAWHAYAPAILPCTSTFCIPAEAGSPLVIPCMMQGESERFIGRWMHERAVARDSVVISTKIAGPSGQMTWIRGGPHKVHPLNQNTHRRCQGRWRCTFGAGGTSFRGTCTTSVTRSNILPCLICLQVDAANIRAAIDGSLQRLGTDYIDLVFVHWPDRYATDG
jgi:aryl-alcohol dehydrogenase-like predicted oxidoreductase